MAVFIEKRSQGGGRRNQQRRSHADDRRNSDQSNHLVDVLSDDYLQGEGSHALTDDHRRSFGTAYLLPRRLRGERRQKEGRRVTIYLKEPVDA